MQVTKQEFKTFLFARDFTILADIWNKSGSVIIRRFKDNSTNKVIGLITNWKKYFILRS